VAVGVVARQFACLVGKRRFAEEAFLSGLIHDLGLLVERQAFPEQLAQAIDRCEAGEGDLITLEEQVIGADHQAFGDALTAKWRFPRNLRAVIGFHHFPDRLSSELLQLGAITRTADILCCQEKIGFPLAARNDEFTQELLDGAGVTVDQLTEIRAGLDGLVNEAEATLTGQ